MHNRLKQLEEAKTNFLSGVGAAIDGKFEIDPFQEQAILNVVDGNDTLVVAPTGAGKTHIAFEAIKAALFQKKRAVYTTPLKALSNGKFIELKKRFEPEFKVGILTGDRKIEGDASVVVATTEIYRNELYRCDERYSLVVLDEVHYLADEQRGPVWEESIILTPKSSTLLMLSASISNPEEISDWISDVRGKPCKIVYRKERPVELRYGFLHPDLGIMPLYDHQGGCFREVLHYYAEAEFNQSGLRLRNDRRGRLRSSRGSRQRRTRRSGSNKGSKRYGAGRGR
jgi:superfamily II RNA helicase